MPPLNSSRRGPPQDLVGPVEDNPKTTTYTSQEGDTARQSHQKGTKTPNGYWPRLAPRRLIKKYSQRPIIYRPHRARKASPLGVQLPFPAQRRVAPRRLSRLGSSRRPLPELERTLTTQPSVKGPASKEWNGRFNRLSRSILRGSTGLQSDLHYLPPGSLPHNG